MWASYGVLMWHWSLRGKFLLCWDLFGNNNKKKMVSWLEGCTFCSAWLVGYFSVSLFVYLCNVLVICPIYTVYCVFWGCCWTIFKNVQCSVFANQCVPQSRLWRTLRHQMWNIRVEMPSCVGGNAVDLMRCVKSDYLHTSTQATHETPSGLSYFTVGGLVVIDRQNLFTRCWQSRAGGGCLVKTWYLIGRIKLTNYFDTSILSVMCTVKRINLW